MKVDVSAVSAEKDFGTRCSGSAPLSGWHQGRAEMKLMRAYRRANALAKSVVGLLMIHRRCCSLPRVLFSGGRGAVMCAVCSARRGQRRPCR